MGSGELTALYNSGQAKNPHPVDVSRPEYLGLPLHVFDAGDLSLFKGVSSNDKVTPDDFTNGGKAALMEPFKELLVVLTSDPPILNRLITQMNYEHLY